MGRTWPIAAVEGVRMADLLGSPAVTSFVDFLLLGLPVALVLLLLGLGLVIHVLATEGQRGSASWAQVVGIANLLMVIPLGLLALSAPSHDQRWMFMFVGSAFVLVGLLGLRVPRRFRD